jgi:hypothetical protein
LRVLCCFFKWIKATAGQHNISTMLGQDERGAASDSGTSTRDDGHAAIQ